MGKNKKEKKKNKIMLLLHYFVSIRLIQQTTIDVSRSKLNCFFIFYEFSCTPMGKNKKEKKKNKLCF